MSAATIDRRLTDKRARCKIRGQVGTKPGFVEIDTAFHDSGNQGGGHAFTLTVTDIATDRTDNRPPPDRTAKHKRRPTAMAPRPSHHLHPSTAADRIVAPKRTYSLINPATTQRQIQALTTQLFTLATNKAPASVPTPATKRARSREATCRH